MLVTTASPSSCALSTLASVALRGTRASMTCVSRGQDDVGRDGCARASRLRGTRAAEEQQA